MILEIGYLICACGFFLGLKFLSSPKLAKSGNLLSALAMLLATILCLIQNQPTKILGLFIALLLGSIVGIWAAKKVKMTAMPQLVAVFNGLGGMASVLVALAETARFFYDNNHPDTVFIITSWLSIVIGAITFSGSIIAFVKLQELISSKPIILPTQKLITIGITFSCLATLFFLNNPQDIFTIFLILSVIATILGVLLVIPIGGADMPVVISLLNSYSGIAALTAGFVVKSNLLIIAGSLVGASGIILTRLMCQAMNRSLTNVIFGAFSAKITNSSHEEQKPYKEFSPLDAAIALNNASKVMVIPGYGLAVSQAQKILKDLSDNLSQNGVIVKYAIHPVAGRMPGHMNVLLAEADIPYDDLLDLDEANSEFDSTDVVVLIGANDVVNPAAKNDKNSPLFGMPILEAYKAKSILVFKRGKGHGFAGVENPLFTYDNANVIFGDAKASLLKVNTSLKDL